jgi:hypothetical protein
MPSFFYLLKQKIICKHIPQNKTYDKNQNSLLRKELAKIIISHNLKDSMAHLQLEIRKLQMSLAEQSVLILIIR